MQIANDGAARETETERERERKTRDSKKKKDRGRVGGKKFPAIIAGVTRIGER